jgi:two-component system invasion response regulator UvrY
MYISIVSSSKKNLIPPDLEKSKALDLHTVKSLQSAIDNNSPLEIIFFDADLGEKTIVQQISLCPSQWLVINIANNIQQALQYLQLGASGILTAPFTDEKLQRSIQSIASKTLYIDDGLQQILAFRQIQKMLQPFSKLSSREFDIFCLLAENVSIQDVAEQLSITTKTAFNCQTQLRQKLGLKNQQQIIYFAKSHSLIF